jgi:hypothetical protein
VSSSEEEIVSICLLTEGKKGKGRDEGPGYVISARKEWVMANFICYTWTY